MTFWCEDVGNLIRLAKSMQAAGLIGTASEAVDIFERPWRYQRQWDNLEAGRHVAADAEVQDERLLSREEAAAMLGVSPQTLSAWRQAGSGPTCVKTEGRLKYTRADLRKWIEEHREAGNGAAHFDQAS